MPINNVGGIGPASHNPVSDAAHEHVANARHGETVSDVARRHGVETRSLLEANPQLKDAYQTLNAGQEIQLPQGPTATSQPDQTTAAGRVDHPDITITKHVDAASPKLYEAATSAPTPLGDPTAKVFIQGQLNAAKAAPAGESTDDKHKDWIELASSVPTGQTVQGDTTTNQPVTAERPLDAASKKLHEAASTGKHIPEVKVEL